MFYTVTEIAEKTGLSKQGVYNKLKSTEVKSHLSKKQGVTYVDDDGVKLIEDSINGFVRIEEIQPERIENKPLGENFKDVEIAEIVETDYVKYLKSENEKLWAEMKEKNSQLNNLSRLVENGQVLLKDRTQDMRLLEGRCNEVDVKLEDVKERMTGRKNEPTNGVLKKLFGMKK